MEEIGGERVGVTLFDITTGMYICLHLDFIYTNPAFKLNTLETCSWLTIVPAAHRSRGLPPSLVSPLLHAGRGKAGLSLAGLSMLACVRLFELHQCVT